MPGTKDELDFEDNGPNDQPLSRKPSSHALKKENIPPLHPPSSNVESSFVEGSSANRDQHLDSMTEEQQIRAHLQDVESSFAPPLSPIQVTGPEGGIDDTYLFDVAAGAKPSGQLDPHPASSGVAAAPALNHTNSRTSPPPAEADASQEEPDPATDAEVSNTTSSLENMFSSPTAAAAARTLSRAVSMTSNPQAYGQDYATSDDASYPRDSSKLEVPHTDASFSAGAPTLHQRSSELDLRKTSSGDAGNTPGQALRFGKRPKYLRSRNASQRSSTSSFLTNDDGESDVTVGLGTDYAIQSGGAIPSYGMQRSLSNILSRSVSMGSMVSGFDDYADSGRGLEPLEPLEEVEGSPNRSPMVNGADDHLTTPKAKKSSGLLAPTDTVIARHVRNVEVPDSLAREYKTKRGLETPTQPYRKISAEYTPAPGTAAKNGRNLTLKEQSSTIERLSKENFDLKLKVMFLSDRLDKLSEEGVKEMISENVELKTSLAVIQRDNKLLRRRVKELERRLRDEEDTRPSTARSGYSSDGQTASPFDPDAQEREEELFFLRERVEEYVTEIEQLKSENMANQAEKRKLAEVVKTMGDRAGERVGDSLGRQEEADVFKDLLEQETARREQADDDNRKLRDEIFRLKQEVNVLAAGGSIGGGGPGGLHHTTNIYNITRKARPSSPTRSRPVSGLSGELDQGGSMSQATTLAEELRRESDQLRHENAELRREVGAQTSMLTSRNREKERLYQEIEDLKLAQRRGGPAPSTIDSLLDRSASRAGAHERSHSRGSARTRLTMAVEDPEREEFEVRLAENRDKINELKLQNQELQRELETCMEDFETAVEAKRQAEDATVGLQEELDNTMNDLMALQAERDEALQDHSHLESEFEVLRKEAQDEIDALEGEADQRNEEIQRLQIEVQDRAENFNALQEEMRKMSEALIGLEDEQENKHRRIEQLESEASDANKELEELETKLLESNDKANRLSVQQESSQGEIAFLREEQEADKIRIGDLEAALANTEQGLREERDRAKELDQRLAKERRQREIIATREKEDVQQFVNELNREMTTAKDEARRLRKNLTSREVEATEWKERLMELENNLREALGDLNGTRSSLLKSIAKLQRELENTVRELDTTKASILEKDRIIKQRDALLESHGLESRKLAEMLDKERQGHRNTKNAFETFQRTHQHVSRTVTSQDGRILELESSRANDKKNMAQLEANFKEQLVERNNLLLVLWTRLSTLCGIDWAHNNSLINGRALPSLEAVSTMLPGFSKNLLAAIRTIETLIGGFQGRIKAVEKDLWKEYQTLDNSLDVRTKKLDRLETIVRSGIASGDFSTTTKISQLEAAVRALNIENATLMRANDAKTRAVSGYFDHTTNGRGGADNVDDHGSPSPNIPTGPIRKTPGIPRSKTTHLEATSSSSAKSRNSTMTRSISTHIQLQPAEPLTANREAGEGDNKWMFRLRELEYKLKQEREARNMDRAAARQRIAEGERQKDELTAELVRVSKKKGGE
ncbi:microtubule associated protein [Xylariales sp. AK1849]|nr:microtubule associated protein [Xylariales sp. AK1849]